MKTWMRAAGVAVLVSLVCWGCGRKSGEKTGESEAVRPPPPPATPAEAATPQAPADFAKAMQEMEKARQKAGAVEPVDFRSLRDLLPEKIEGFERTDISGEKSGIMGIKISTAEATYTSDDGTIGIKITDMGGTGAPMQMMGAGWAMSEVDRETSTGYEKTTKIRGYKARESFENDPKHGTIEILVAGRFLVELDGYGFDMETVKKALDGIDLAGLESLAKEK